MIQAKLRDNALKNGVTFEYQYVLYSDNEVFCTVIGILVQAGVVSKLFSL